MAAGFGHHMTKPVDPADVEKLLQVSFERRDRSIRDG
jgi:hypothetical protein